MLLLRRFNNNNTAFRHLSTAVSSSQGHHLPRLPIPSLQDSTSRYMAALRPVVDDVKVLQGEEAAVKEFLRQGGVGEKLQKELVELDSRLGEHSSYVGAFWDTMYLEGRWPLAVHSNPGTLESSHVGGLAKAKSQLEKATIIVCATLEYCDRIRTGKMESDMMRGRRIDMTSYSRMAGMTRIPMLKRDVLVQHDKSTHICVLHKSRFYRVQVLDRNTHAPLPPSVIYGKLSSIVEDGKRRGVNTSGDANLAALTTLDRDTWAGLYGELKATSTPGVLDKDVCGALFHLALDHEVATTRNDKVRSALHGSGRNRWFDHGLSVHVAADGTFSTSFEHSWGDGLAVMRWGSFVHENAASYLSGLSTAQQQNKEIATPLEWGSSVSSRVLKAAQEAQSKFMQFTTKDLKLETRVYSEFGTDALKAWKVSPDGIFQNAIQLAYRRLKHKTVATYESCSTQTFAGGRTETIRSATAESQQFVMEMMDCLVDDTRIRQDLLRKAAKRHSEIAIDAAEGRGFDRHLFVLKQLAIANGVQPPLLFGPGFDVLSKNILSTSTVSHPCVEQASFGPVVSNGLGICYHMFPNKFHFCVTSYEDNAVAMADCMERSLRDCMMLLQRSMK